MVDYEGEKNPSAEGAVIVGKDKDLRTVNTRSLICLLLLRRVKNSRMGHSRRTTTKGPLGIQHIK